MFAGVETGVTVFVGQTETGPSVAPASINSASEFEAAFGPLNPMYPLGYAVSDFFANGGIQAVIIRLVPENPRQEPQLPPGGVGKRVRQLTRARLLPAGALSATDYLGNLERRGGLSALDQVDHFNLLCLPPDTLNGGLPPGVLAEAARICFQRKAILLVDPPAEWGADAQAALTWLSDPEAGLARLDLPVELAANAALYFPRLARAMKSAGPSPQGWVPCGAVAGVIARTDLKRGVWKAPAGPEAYLNGFNGLTADLTKDQTEALSLQGVNCLRAAPNGILLWGARTLQGASSMASEWKYLNVRRLHLYIEESITRGLKWVALENNGPDLWARVRREVQEFLYTLYRAGGLVGTTPDQALFVRCDTSTMTTQDIAEGQLVVMLGYAPLKPAEFVIIRVRVSTRRP